MAQKLPVRVPFAKPPTGGNGSAIRNQMRQLAKWEVE